MQRAYRESTRVLGALLCLLGIALVVVALARGGGPVSIGVVLGALLALLGAARFTLAGDRRRGG